MSVSPQAVKDLREKTGAGMMDCKKALVEANGDEEKAIEILRKKGLSQAAKRAGKEAKEGLIETYIHTGAKLGVMVEINCETDFVAKTDVFKQLAKDVAMHTAATNPVAVSRDDVSEDTIAKEKDIYIGQMEASGKKKPPEVMEKIISGKLDKYFSEVCLLEQPFVKDPDKTVGDLVTEASARLGEKIVVRQFCRMKVGE